jgi:LPS-assembly protein
LRSGPSNWNLRLDCAGALLAAATVVVWSGIPAGANAQPIATTPPSEPAEDAEPAPDDRVVVLADTISNEQDASLVIAEGEVEARYQGRTLRAQKLIYDRKTGVVRAQGSVQIIDPDGSVRYADELEVDDELADGVATDFSTRFPGGATAIASSAIRREGEFSEFNKVIYTACKLCEDGKSPPTWTLRARRARQDIKDQMITYQDAVLEVKGVPILYAPYFAHPDPSSKRRSGLLFPDGGESNRLGFYYRQPYYQVISPSQDLTLIPQVNSKQNPLLGAEWRKRFFSGEVELTGSGTYESEFDGDGNALGPQEWRGHLFGKGDFKVTDYWRWGFAAATASDRFYLSRYDIDGANEQRGLFLTEPLRLGSQLYATGQGANSYVSAAVMGFQSLRAGENQDAFPQVLPLVEAYRNMQMPGVGGQLRLTGTAAALTRTFGDDSARVSASAAWERPAVIAGGILVKPFAEVRADYFDTTQVDTRAFPSSPLLADRTSSFGRGVALAGVEARYPLIRPLGRGSVLIEPILVAAYGSTDANDDRIPNEDSRAFELDDSSLLRPNAAPGFDLWEGGGRVAAAVRGSLRMGRAEASLLVGRRWRSDEERIASPLLAGSSTGLTETAVFNRFSNLDRKASDWVSSATLRYGTNFATSARLRFDGDDGTLLRSDVAAFASVWRVDANVRYLQIDSSLRDLTAEETFKTFGTLTPSPTLLAKDTRELTGGLGVRVTQNWSIGYNVRRDLALERNLRQDASLTFTDDCTFVQLIYSRSDVQNGPIGRSDSVRIRFGLATLGNFGRD